MQELNYEQMTLSLVEPEKPTRENFVIGNNAALFTALDAFLLTDRNQFFYIWGEKGCGKSHLLKSLAAQVQRVPVFDPQTVLYTVDDVDTLTEDESLALFYLMNEVRAHPGTKLVLTGNKAPAGLCIREDVKSRLSWGLVFELHSLSEDLVFEEFKRRAKVRGIEITPELTQWIQTYCPRSMQGLNTLLESADRYALQTKRRVTIPLLHHVLDAELDL